MLNCLRSVSKRVLPPHRIQNVTGINARASSVARGDATKNPQTLSYEDEFKFFSRKTQSSVNLRALMETGRGIRLNQFEQSLPSNSREISHREKIRIQVACFLHRELPVRFAHRAIELENYPLFRENKHIMTVCNWYRESFRSLRECPAPVDTEKEEMFARTVNNIYDRHSFTLITMAQGAHELRNTLGHEIGQFAESSDVQKRLDEFYFSRIGIRMLIGQYLAIRSPQGSSKDGQHMIGLISQKASPKDIALQAIDDAAFMCSRTHGDAPEVTLHGRTDLTFPYVPSHLQYILLELLKNSMRATVETHGIDNMPPIRVIIADSVENEDVVIKVSDEGGGIKRSDMHKIWSYLFTTADPSILDSVLNTDQADFTTASPLAGLGYGIPISRNYARYFGGDLTIMSMEGYGTDSFVYMKKLQDDKDV